MKLLPYFWTTAPVVGGPSFGGNLERALGLWGAGDICHHKQQLHEGGKPPSQAAVTSPTKKPVQSEVCRPVY